MGRVHLAGLSIWRAWLLSDNQGNHRPHKRTSSLHWTARAKTGGRLRSPPKLFVGLRENPLAIANQLVIELERAGVILENLPDPGGHW